MLSDAIYQNAEKIIASLTKARKFRLRWIVIREMSVISNGIDYDAFSQIPLKEPDNLD